MWGETGSLKKSRTINGSFSTIPVILDKVGVEFSAWPRTRELAAVGWESKVLFGVQLTPEPHLQPFLVCDRLGELPPFYYWWLMKCHNSKSAPRHWCVHRSLHVLVDLIFQNSRTKSSCTGPHKGQRVNEKCGWKARAESTGHSWVTFLWDLHPHKKKRGKSLTKDMDT